MKTLKISIIAFVLTILISASSTDVNAWPRVRVYAGTPKIGVVAVKPGPNYVWVEGHYKLDKFGRLVWVPAHWKKI